MQSGIRDRLRYARSALRLSAAVLCVSVCNCESASGLDSVPGDGLVFRADRACGSNCLYFVLRACDIEVDYLRLHDELVRDRLPSLTDLRESAERRGVELTLGRLTRAELISAPKPVICHCEIVGFTGQAIGHFVVVTGADSQRVHYVDGTSVESIVTRWEDFERNWTGAAGVIGQRRDPRTLLAAVCIGFAAAHLSVRFWTRRSRRERHPDLPK
ncbi:MAG: cysteine peptidase family C39 domain-containing protein [Planctomycetaceae bacterium]